MENRVLLDLGERGAISPDVVRRFVTELAEVNETIKDARTAFKEAVESNDEIADIDQQIADLKEARKQVLETNPVIVAYKGPLEDAMGDRKDLIRDAKRDGVPRGEIDLAIRALKKDLDLVVSSEIYGNISDLVE